MSAMCKEVRHIAKSARKYLKTNNRPSAQCVPFILPSSTVVFRETYLLSSLILYATIIHDSMLYAAIPYCGVDSRCAVQSFALCDDVAALLICSVGTVVAHFSIGLTEHHHGQSGAVRPSRDRRGRRQDNVRSAVPGLHRSSSARVDSLCQMAPASVPSPCVPTSVAPFIDALPKACDP